jgi:hypothetical protein
VVRITIRLDGREVAAELFESPTGLDLAGLLPLTVPLSDFHGQEKLGRLPRPLSLQGAPHSSGAGPGDIGYYSPSNHLVLYYLAVGSFPGIVPVGRFDDDAVAYVRGLADPVEAVLTVP